MTCRICRGILEELKDEGKISDDILWVGSKTTPFKQKPISGSCSWEEFCKIAETFGEGYRYLMEDLIIVGSDWWLERNQDYESRDEWWEFKRQPERSMYSNTLTSGMISDD